MHFETAPGASLAATTAVGEPAVRIMEGLPEVAHVVMHVGRAHLSNGNALTNKAEIAVGLSARGNADSAAAKRRILVAVKAPPRALVGEYLS